MPHQILDRDRSLERREIELVAIDDADLHVGEGGDVGRHGIADQKATLLHQHHRGDRNDRLRHRIDAKDRVIAHRRPARAEQADILAIGDLPVAGDQHGDAGGLLLLDLPRHDGREPLQALGDEPDGFGRGIGEDGWAHRGLTSSDSGDKMRHARAVSKASAVAASLRPRCWTVASPRGTNSP